MLLALSPGQEQLEKVDITDCVAAGLTPSSFAQEIAAFSLERTSAPNTVEIRPAQKRCATLGVVVYVLEKAAAVQVREPERVLFPEEFGMTTGVPTAAIPGKRFTLSGLHFFGNSALIENPEAECLDSLFVFLQVHPTACIVLTGHVNGSMGRAYLRRAARTNPEHVAYKNAQHLSEARAEQVKRHLVLQGIDASRISTAGRGGKDRIYTKPKNASQHAANRRIEGLVLGCSGQ